MPWLYDNSALLQKKWKVKEQKYQLKWRYFSRRPRMSRTFCLQDHENSEPAENTAIPRGFVPWSFIHSNPVSSYQIRSSTASRGSWMQPLRFVYWPPLLTSQGHGASFSAFRVPQMYRSMPRHSRGQMAQRVRALLTNLIHSLFNGTGLFMTWRKRTFSVDFIRWILISLFIYFLSRLQQEMIHQNNQQCSEVEHTQKK